MSTYQIAGLWGRVISQLFDQLAVRLCTQRWIKMGCNSSNDINCNDFWFSGIS